MKKLDGRSNRNLSRILGFAPLEGIEALRTALAAVPGSPPLIRHGAGVAALIQAEPATPLQRRDRKSLLAGLQTVQRRLETACQLGAFLPMDPAAACCASSTLAQMLDTSWEALAGALERRGNTHQWDIVLRWKPEPAVARRRADILEASGGHGGAALADAVAAALRAERDGREVALLAALAPAVLGFAPGGATGGEAQVALTVLVPRHGEAAIEAALGRLSAEAALDADLDLRGPLPPVSFAAARIASVEQGEIASAWRRLDLPPLIDAADLHRHWRLRAAAAHPDRLNDQDNHDAGARATRTAAGEAVSDIGDSYRLLRGLLPTTAPGGAGGKTASSFSLSDLQLRAGPRLVLPPDAAARPAPRAPLATSPAMPPQPSRQSSMEALS